ncbi:hypothetical protein BJ912DRAFT_1054714 [Pholiota molesta]|nr:hypothetical protein BJ912DRAFT_1054714 [Pholiota molesta]
MYSIQIDEETPLQDNSATIIHPPRYLITSNPLPSHTTASNVLIGSAPRSRSEIPRGPLGPQSASINSNSLPQPGADAAARRPNSTAAIAHHSMDLSPAAAKTFKAPLLTPAGTDSRFPRSRTEHPFAKGYEPPQWRRLAVHLTFTRKWSFWVLLFIFNVVISGILPFIMARLIDIGVNSVADLSAEDITRAQNLINAVQDPNLAWTLAPLSLKATSRQRDPSTILEPGSILRFPRWGLRTRCANIPSLSDNLLVSTDNLTYLFTPRDTLKSLFTDFGMDLPSTFEVPINLTDIMNTNDTRQLSKGLDQQSIAMGAVFLDDGAGYSTRSAPFNLGDFGTGFVTLETALIRLNTTLRRMVSSQRLVPFLFQMCKDSIRFSDMTLLGRSGRYLPSPTIASFTSSSGPLSYTSLIPSSYAHARSLADASILLPYLAGSAPSLARRYSDRLLTTTSIHALGMACLLAGVCLLGLVVGCGYHGYR